MISHPDAMLKNKPEKQKKGSIKNKLYENEQSLYANVQLSQINDKSG